MTDLALLNARVWHRPSQREASTAVLARHGRIAMVGRDDEVRVAAGSSATVVDLHGAALLPGFVDSHTHFHRTAILREHFLDFDDVSVRRIDDVIAGVRARAASMQADQWIEGDNLVGARLAERRLPTRLELDSAAPENPVLLRGMGKHVVVANSTALRLAGIDASTPDPPGGRIERDRDGYPTGVLHERGKLRLDTTRMDTVVPPLDEAARLSALAAGVASLHRAGVTSIHEITRTRDELADYSLLRESGRLKLRVRAYVRIVEGQATLDGLASAGLRTGFGDDWLRLGGVKVSIDGACTFRNAALYEPYPGEPGNVGITRIEQPQLDELVRAAEAAGLQIAVHAIGPRAVDMALDAFERAGSAASRLRHRVEHAYLAPRAGQFARIRQLGLLLSIQPAFIPAVGDAWFDIFPADEVEQMVALRSALDAGLTVMANSDCPTAPPEPLLGIAAAVTRRTSSGRELGPSERVSITEAVDMYTSAPAVAAHEEDQCGRIRVGSRADLVALGADPLSVAPGDVADIPVAMTVIDGDIVHRTDDT